MVGLVLKFVGLSKADYDAVNVELANDEEFLDAYPLGLMSHAAGVADGALYVIEVWDSREAQDVFMQGVLGRAFQAAGLKVVPEVTWIDQLSYNTFEDHVDRARGGG